VVVVWVAVVDDSSVVCVEVVVAPPVTVFVGCPMITNRLAEISTPAMTIADAMAR
jgi:hypothetical protein